MCNLPSHPSVTMSEAKLSLPSKEMVATVSGIFSNFGPALFLGGYAVAVVIGFHYYSRSAKVRRNWNTFIMSVANVLRNAEKVDQVSQLKRHYESYSTAMKTAKYNVRSMAGEMWEVVEYHDGQPAEAFKRRYKVDLTKDERNRIVEIVEELENNEPYAQLPSPWGSRLDDIKTALEKSNVELGTRALDELATQLYQREEVQRKETESQQRKNTIYQWVSISLTLMTFTAGTILTFVLAHK
jgi:hypothetical protein